MKVSKGQSQPEIVAAAFLILEAWFWVDYLIPGFDCDSSVSVKMPAFPLWLVSQFPLTIRGVHQFERRVVFKESGT